MKKILMLTLLYSGFFVYAEDKEELLNVKHVVYKTLISRILCKDPGNEYHVIALSVGDENMSLQDRVRSNFFNVRRLLFRNPSFLSSDEKTRYYCCKSKEEAEEIISTSQDSFREYCFALGENLFKRDVHIEFRKDSVCLAAAAKSSKNDTVIDRNKCIQTGFEVKKLMDSDFEGLVKIDNLVIKITKDKLGSVIDLSDLIPNDDEIRFINNNRFEK